MKTLLSGEVLRYLQQNKTFVIVLAVSTVVLILLAVGKTLFDRKNKK